ncbi:hypothetical protein BDV96DRAFT_655232 [Lophiotrema nucula]|uniref:Uncharacterized protein n=1 Tax=Lophiotrema nucula TaxID=690887 RepID=A0A6A5YFE9_9PLEO|nr:hypothetical protein BDV96DRAFT_655232 [Lophiotrema nucula]
MCATFDGQCVLRRCMKTKASNFIERLGLIPDNVNTSAYPKFHSTPIVQNLYAATQERVDFIFSSKSREELHSLLAIHDPFYINGATEYLLEEYGGKVWGDIERSHLRQAKTTPTDLYPEDLYYHNDKHYEKLKIFLCCWITNRVFRKLGKSIEARDSPSNMIRINSTGRDHRQVSLSPEPDSLRDEAELAQRFGIQQPPNNASTRFYQGPIGAGDLSEPRHLATCPHSLPTYRAPEAPPMHRATTVGLQQATTERPFFQASSSQNNSSVETSSPALERRESEATISAEHDGEEETYQDEASDDPDYEPGLRFEIDKPASRKRRKTTSHTKTGKAGRLSRPRIGPSTARSRHETTNKVYSVPTPPALEEARVASLEPSREIRFTPFLGLDLEGEHAHLAVQEETAGETVAPQAGVSTPLGITSETEFRRNTIENTEQVAKAVASDVQAPHVLTHVKSAQSRILRIELTELLLSHCGSDLPNDAHLDRLVQLTKLFWEVDDLKLAETLGDSFATFKLSFDRWVEMLGKLSHFRRQTKYYGKPGASWITYCRSLPSLQERRSANVSKLHLKTCLASVKLNDSKFNVESFSKDMATILYELSSELDLDMKDMEELMLDFNRSVLEWFQ